MSRRCELTGIGPMVGHSVSHSNIKTKRRFLPSLKTVKVTSDALGQTFSLRISNAALRTLDALGDLDGKTVLIHGAAGGVGSMAVQIAKAAGARVIGTASERNHHYLRGLGAEPITYGKGLADRVRELADGPVDAVADFVGG